MMFPPMPLAEWRDTKETLHRFLQIAGKVRLDLSPLRNHWWNVPFYLTARGLTSRPMGRETFFTIDFDFVEHLLRVDSSTGQRVSFPLTELSVAGFYRQLLAALSSLGFDMRLAHPAPFDLTDSTPFAEDEHHASYVPTHANRYWQILGQVSLILEEFAGRSYAKTSPVHHFWHTMDIAVTRFSDRTVDPPDDVDPVTREAYSHEVISAGFWFGDDVFGEPAFYSYTAPEPAGLTEEPLRPAEAAWVPRGSAHLAVLRYDDARISPDPRGSVLAFLESAYLAGARRAGWDIDKLRHPRAVGAG
ncbi:MAG: hypothetical protein QOI26_755 [Pseudonocardiales bacterium]|jgi:hypothetical protein|nr:hypothetical protein [Pseudonocardiales bacterium]